MTRAEFAAEIREKYMLNQEISESDCIETYDALFHTGSKLIKYFNRLMDQFHARSRKCIPDDVPESLFEIEE